MRPRSIDRGNGREHWQHSVPTEKGRASMRPRSIDRGNALDLWRYHGKASRRFNEAPINRPGKCVDLRQLYASAQATRFNEAPINRPGKYGQAAPRASRPTMRPRSIDRGNGAATALPASYVQLQ